MYCRATRKAGTALLAGATVHQTLTLSNATESVAVSDDGGHWEEKLAVAANKTKRV